MVARAPGRQGEEAILFIAPSRIGDAVIASGLVSYLVQTRPRARFTLVASALSAPLFEATPGLERLIQLEKRPLGGHWPALWRQVWPRRWALAVDLRGSALTGFLRADRRAVHRAGRRVEPKVVEAARTLGLQDRPPDPHIFVDPESEAEAAARVPPGAPILALGPAANWTGKAWPAERFAALARTLLGPSGPLAGGRLMVLAGPADRAVAQTVLAALPPARRLDLAGTLSLRACAAALRRASLFVGNDSGLMHLAAAAGAPTLGLFGPSDDRAYAPWGEKARALRGPRPFSAYLALDPGLNRPLDHMADLELPAVLAAARALIDAYPPAA